MNDYAIVYVNVFAIVILIVTLKNYRLKFSHLNRDERTFLVLILSTIAVLIIGAVLKNLFSIEGRFVYYTLYVLQILDFILSVFITMMFLYFCIFRIYNDISRKVFLKYILPLPAVIFAVFLIASTSYGLVFEINAQNDYSRGPAFIVNIIFAYIYVSSALALLIVKRKSLTKGELYPYLLVPIIPLLIGIFEVVVKVPVSLTWPATSIVWLVIQVYILNSKTNTDHLTGLNNRLALDSYIKRLINEGYGSLNSFGVIMLDLDGFKKVNDLYGHNEGDKALKAAADILSTCCAGRFFIARYGGDEFTVVIKDCTEKMLQGILIKIEESRIKHNKALNKPYELVFSVGASIFHHQEITDIHTMFMQVDKMMYENKKAKKLNVSG